MSHTSPFVKSAEEYGRDLNVISNYRKDAALYLHKRTGKDLDVCMEYVSTVTSPGGKFEGEDPTVLCLSKEKPGTRSIVYPTFTEYLQDVVGRKALMSPTMAVYLHPDEHQSLLSTYIANNIAKRSAVKKQKFACTMAGDKQGAADAQILQSTYKVKNNSLSGAHASPYTPLYNKSAHSTLTSTCRMSTGYANANNERFIAGNRHYYNPTLVLNNIVSVVRLADYPLIESTMELYGIVAPTVDQTAAAIKSSTDLYWNSPADDKVIRDLLASLTPIELAAYLYTGDMYHLRAYNNDMVYTLVDTLSTKVTTPVSNPDQYIEAMDEDLVAFIGIICAKELDGGTIRDTKKKNPLAYSVIAATTKHILDTLQHYSKLVEAFWRTESAPASVAGFTSSIRKTVLVSDTDSTIFTVQDWTMWFDGKISFSDKSNAVAAVMVYLTSQVLRHLLAQMAGNMGVPARNLFVLAMKNEFMYPTMMLTGRAKHYASYIQVQEGNVFAEPEFEVKGVALKSSKVPPHVMRKLDELIKSIMDTVISGNKIVLKEVLTEVGDLERDIRKSLELGKIDYLTTQRINSKTAYKKPYSSSYLYYEMWEDVFGPKYGPAPEPTYIGVKVSLTSHNSTGVVEWIESIEDHALAERLRNWLLKHSRQGGLQQIIIPLEIVNSIGIPIEIRNAIDIRKIIYGTMQAFYLTLESYNIFMNDKHLTKLISDTY